jgi:hypothetical protein
MKRIYKITLLVGITILVSSCHNNSAPNYQYFPNMYESVGYETYSEASVFKGGKEAGSTGGKANCLCSRGIWESPKRRYREETKPVVELPGTTIIF